MDISKLFKDLHGPIGEVIPVSNTLTPTELKTLSTLMDPSYTYEIVGGMVHRYAYWDDFIFIPFLSINSKELEMMRVKDRITAAYAILSKHTEWHKKFDFADKKILLHQYIKHHKAMPRGDAYDIFITLYVRSEYGFEGIPLNVLEYVFSCKENSKERPKRMRELKTVTGGEDPITVYRGICTESASAETGMSWTLSEDTAERFAYRFGADGDIVTKQITVSDVIDFISSRGEDEILLYPKRHK